MKVLKFGGTSVGTPDRMHGISKLITADNERKIVVLSALSGTTNALVSIGVALKEEKTEAVQDAIAELHAHYINFYKSLVTTEEAKERALAVIEEHFDFIKSLKDHYFNQRLERELLAQGELMSTKLFHIYLDEAGIKSPDVSVISDEFLAEVEGMEHKNLAVELLAVLRPEAG